MACERTLYQGLHPLNKIKIKPMIKKLKSFCDRMQIRDQLISFGILLKTSSVLILCCNSLDLRMSTLNKDVPLFCFISVQELSLMFYQCTQQYRLQTIRSKSLSASFLATMMPLSDINSIQIKINLLLIKFEYF